jgi:pimeloyl-ACP methyl ester carboxylesterase
LRQELFPEKVARNIDLVMGVASEVSLASLPQPVPEANSLSQSESLFFPRGTIRSLDDPIFSRRMAELGMYDPAAFMESAPMMFYALEEDLGFKVPVVFVHGIGGNAQEFQDIVARLDRKRYKPWFFHCPSGMDLQQVGQLFYDIFLSAKVIPGDEMPMVIVAHSMGGLVVREAMNHYAGDAAEARLQRVVTIASPFGGMKSAGIGPPCATRGSAMARPGSMRRLYRRTVSPTTMRDRCAHRALYVS